MSMNGRGCHTSAPGKLILFGEHAVVFGRKGIASAVDLRTHIKLTECSGGRFVLVRSEPFAPVALPLSLLTKIARTILPFHEEERYAFLKQVSEILPTPELHLNIIAAFKEFARSTSHRGLVDLEKDLGCLSTVSLFCLLLVNEKDPHPARGWRLEVTSDLPTGAGLGSSSAFHVGVAGAFLKSATKISSPKPLSEEQWKFWTNELAFGMEKIVHGPTASGIDNMISTYGSVLVYHQKAPSFRENLPPLQVLITNTKVPHRSTKTQIAIVRSRHEQFTPTVELILDAIDSISHNFEEMLENSPDASAVDEEKIAGLFSLNHDLLVSLGVSHDAIEEVRKVLSDRYNLHTKMTGAGGGGCTITLLPQSILQANLLPNIIHSVKSLPNRNFDCFTAKLGGEGIICHSFTV